MAKKGQKGQKIFTKSYNHCDGSFFDSSDVLNFSPQLIEPIHNII